VTGFKKFLIKIAEKALKLIYGDVGIFNIDFIVNNIRKGIKYKL